MPSTINVLLIGSGGREHAIAAKIAQSPLLGTLYLTDQHNPGLQQLGTPIDVPANRREIYRLVQFLDKHDVQMIVVGPEDPLAEGFVDALRTERRHVFGPTQAGARLEYDKAWAKQFMRQCAIPTAEGRAFTDADAAIAYVNSRTEPPVVKASGLAKGKGVIVPDSRDAAAQAVKAVMLERRFGDAGATCIIEERLRGPEVSVLAVTDGSTIAILDACQDHKRLLDGDKGPNTGGMGAICPSPLIDTPMLARIEREILIPTVDGLKREGIDYRGVIYAGIMLTHGGPKVLEFNARFGDPEAQVLLPRFDCDVLQLMLLAAQQRLHSATLRVRPGAACTVVLASDGYPDSPRTGLPIAGLDEKGQLDRPMQDVHVYHAGTRRASAGGFVTAGGRVLAITGLGDDLPSARHRAYEAARSVTFPGVVMRSDIGASAVATLHANQGAADAHALR